MKRIIFVLIILAAITEGCKYEDGPWISLRSAKNRLYGNHTLTKYTINGIDSLQQMENRFGLNFHFYYNDVNSLNALEIYGTNIYSPFISTFNLINKNKVLSITGGSIIFTGFGYPDYQDIDLDILKLKNNDIHMKTMYKNKEYYLELK